MKKEIDNPLLVFAEGTVTSGKHIMKFKKGAFHSLLPIKPSIINTTLNKYHLSVGAAGLLPHFLKTLCYLYNNIEITELPVMKPNDFMFENYSKSHPEITEKWEIYAEVAREIMCKASGMSKTDMTFRESIEYSNLVKGIKKKDNKLLQSNSANNNSKSSN
jgi:lysophosphatidylcholine acyltransferase/lyso-PAF acetyltransferase